MSKLHSMLTPSVKLQGSRWCQSCWAPNNSGHLYHGVAVTLLSLQRRKDKLLQLKKARKVNGHIGMGIKWKIWISKTFNRKKVRNLINEQRQRRIKHQAQRIRKREVVPWKISFPCSEVREYIVEDPTKAYIYMLIYLCTPRFVCYWYTRKLGEWMWFHNRRGRGVKSPALECRHHLRQRFSTWELRPLWEGQTTLS